MTTRPSGQLAAPRMADLVVALAAVMVVGAVVLGISTLQSVPDQKALMTPERVESAPAFAAAVEARTAAADPSRGEALFAQYACAACHHETEAAAGPSRGGMGERAATRRPNYSAAAYLYESIIEPNAFVVPGYAPGVMVQNFKAAIPEADLYDLIAWLLSQ